MTHLQFASQLRIALATLGIALASSPAAAETFNCPAAFPSQALRLVPTEDGWTTGTGDPALLYGAEVFDGPPEQRATLIPDASSKGSSTWKLEGSYPQGIWLQCTYAEGALTLTRRLANTPAVCVARYPKLSKKGRPTSTSFECH